MEPSRSCSHGRFEPGRHAPGLRHFPRAGPIASWQTTGSRRGHARGIGLGPGECRHSSRPGLVAAAGGQAARGPGEFSRSAARDSRIALGAGRSVGEFESRIPCLSLALSNCFALGAMETGDPVSPPVVGSVGDIRTGTADCTAGFTQPDRRHTGHDRHCGRRGFIAFVPPAAGHLQCGNRTPSSGAVGSGRRTAARLQASTRLDGNPVFVCRCRCHYGESAGGNRVGPADGNPVVRRVDAIKNRHGETVLVSLLSGHNLCLAVPGNIPVATIRRLFRGSVCRPDLGLAQIRTDGRQISRLDGCVVLLLANRAGFS